MKVRRMKIFYVPGLLSLIFIVPLCLFYIYVNDYFIDYRVLEIMWLSKNNDNKYNLNTFEYITSRKNIDIELSGDKEIDNENLRWGKSEINKLLKSKDTSIGVHFHFSKTATYESLIEVINICNIEKATVYTPYEDDFWVVNEIPEPIKREDVTFVCGFVETDCNYDPSYNSKEIESINFTKEMKMLKEASITLMIPILISILLFILSARRIWIMNRNNGVS